MTITDIYVKRGRPAPGTLRYDMPGPLRVQIAGIVNEALTLSSDGRESTRYQLYEILAYRLGHELGRDSLTRRGSAPLEQIDEFIRRESPGLVLSLLDTLFSLLLDQPASHDSFDAVVCGAVVDAADELNHRFSEHGIGYRIETFKAVRIGSISFTRRP